jgi:hypothetical protein
MDLAQLIAYFETSPAIRLLRSTNAPYVLAFLHRQFKQSGHIAIGHAELHAALVAYQEDLQETYPEALRNKPEVYLSEWCAQDTRWLHRFLEAGRNEPVYQLTPHTEEVFAFLDRALDKDLGFVGTESRLRLVIETLADLVVGASDDPELRLAHLRGERQRIEDEIRRIEEAGTVASYQPAQIRERFATAVSLLKQLQGDFRGVEEKFKEITQDVQQRQSEGRCTRGGILEFALDAEDLLKQEDQGVSFYEFVRFILSPSQQERLQTVIQQLGRIQELAELTDGMETVRRMVPVLLAEAEKVMHTNSRLSATLRRLLDERAYRDRQRVAQVLREILSLASAMASAPPRDSVGLELETKIEITSPFSRSFWMEPPRFEALDLTERENDEEQRAAAFRALAQMRRLDWRRMRSCIADAVAMDADVTLGRLLASHPPEAGVIEVLGYLQIARDDGHLVSLDAQEEIVLPAGKDGQRKLAVTVPLIRFIPK